MPDEAIRRFVDLGWSNADLAHANEEATGWHPSPAVVSRKLQALGLQAARLHHRALIPWRINPDHAGHPIYYALQAESRRRQLGDDALSSQDKFRVQMLRDLLTRKGAARVVDYDYRKGWSLVPAKRTDKDIIRRPERGRQRSNEGGSSSASSDLSGALASST
jgi:hypothetical protein